MEGLGREFPTFKHEPKNGTTCPTKRNPPPCINTSVDTNSNTVYTYLRLKPRGKQHHLHCMLPIEKDLFSEAKPLPDKCKDNGKYIHNVKCDMNHISIYDTITINVDTQRK